MKILLLADGTSAHTEKWVKSLVANNISVLLFSLRAISKGLESMVSTNQLEVYSCENSVQSNASIFKKSTFLTVLPAVKKRIKSFQPDLVHAHYISSYGLLAYLSGFKPYALSVWGSDIMVFPKRSFIHKAGIKIILSNAQQVFATSQLMLDLVQKDFGKKESMLLPFGIDTASFKPTENLIKDEAFTFIILKSLAQTYGIDIAIEAFQELKSRYPNAALKLLIYGDGPKKDEYMTLAGKYLNDCIHFKGKIPAEEAPKALQQGKVLVNISRSESFGVSVLEASACGLAVIVSNRGGLLETVEPNKTGLVITELSPKACADAMERYLKNPQLVTQHATNGRNFVLDRFRQENLVRTQIKAYKNIIGEV